MDERPYETGLFLLDVYLDGKRLTRMPFKVTITREKPAATPPAAKIKAGP
jgi:hypothetical protein